MSLGIVAKTESEAVSFWVRYVTEEPELVDTFMVGLISEIISSIFSGSRWIGIMNSHSDPSLILYIWERLLMRTSCLIWTID